MTARYSFVTSYQRNFYIVVCFHQRCHILFSFETFFRKGALQLHRKIAWYHLLAIVHTFISLNCLLVYSLLVTHSSSGFFSFFKMLWLN